MGSHITKDTKSIRVFQFNLTQPEVKYLVIATIRSSNMKAFTMSSFVFFIVAITIIAMAKGEDFGACGEWMDETAECREGTEADLGACCKNKGVPYWCSGDCVANDGVCRKWSKHVSECRKSNEAKECCEKQGVPNECSAYCETA